MDQRDRFVFSGPASWPLDQAIRWAAEHGFSRVDFNADAPANHRFIPLKRYHACSAPRRRRQSTR